MLFINLRLCVSMSKANSKKGSKGKGLEKGGHVPSPNVGLQELTDDASREEVKDYMDQLAKLMSAAKAQLPHATSELVKEIEMQPRLLTFR